MDEMKSHVGERYGRLVIVGTAYNERRKRNHVVCRCDCGNLVERQFIHLSKGKVKSCGCLLSEENARRKETARRKEEERRRIHEALLLDQRAKEYIRKCLKEQRQREREMEKEEYHRICSLGCYVSWQAMKKRCNNPNHERYRIYGGRGIRVCDEWNRSYQAFYDWAINNGWKEGLTIDRIDVNGNYEPDNCRWITRKDNSRNKRNNHYITVNGETRCVSEWMEMIGQKTWPESVERFERKLNRIMQRKQSKTPPAQ